MVRLVRATPRVIPVDAETVVSDWDFPAPAPIPPPANALPTASGFLQPTPTSQQQPAVVGTNGGVGGQAPLPLLQPLPLPPSPTNGPNQPIGVQSVGGLNGQQRVPAIQPAHPPASVVCQMCKMRVPDSYRSHRQHVMQRHRPAVAANTVIRVQSHLRRTVPQCFPLSRVHDDMTVGAILFQLQASWLVLRSSIHFSASTRVVG